MYSFHFTTFSQTEWVSIRPQIQTNGPVIQLNSFNNKGLIGLFYFVILINMPQFVSPPKNFFDIINAQDCHAKLYLPVDPHNWYPVVLRQAAVNEVVVVVVEVVVTVEVPK
jgi:hypothetical protein